MRKKTDKAGNRAREIAASVLLGVIALALFCSCRREALSGEEAAEMTGEITLPGSNACVTEILFSAAAGFATKSEDPDEHRITDANIFIFNESEQLEEHFYISSSEMFRTSDGEYGYRARLLTGCTYSVFVCANTGFRVNCKNLDELLNYRFFLAYPDDYRIGIPMSGVRKSTVVNAGDAVTVPLKRAMAKISVSIDRSALADGVEFSVTSIQIKNCPRSVRMFGDSKAGKDNGTYVSGFFKSEGGADPLNVSTVGQRSGEVSLYMLENMQGTPLGEISDYNDKVFEEDDANKRQCSYIELSAEYISDDYYSLPGEGLVYRFYLGESPSDFNVQRNCHYHITVKPVGSGIEGDGWRVDKSGLGYRGPVLMKVTPGTYIRGKIGEQIHIRCEILPADAPFDIGLEELEYDKERGIYDYRVDEDGKGVLLTLTGSGRGLVYFEAGEPINDAALIVIEVDLEGD